MRVKPKELEAAFRGVKAARVKGATTRRQADAAIEAASGGERMDPKTRLRVLSICRQLHLEARRSLEQLYLTLQWAGQGLVVMPHIEDGGLAWVDKWIQGQTEVAVKALEGSGLGLGVRGKK